MVNDPRNFTIEGNTVDYEGLSTTPTQEVIKDYIRIHEISPIGVSIVHGNAKQGFSPPSQEGTMRNLYNMFSVFYNNQGAK